MDKVDRGAIRPEFNIQSYIQEKQAEEKGATPDEQVLAAGANTKFWKILKSHIDSSIEQLEAIQDAAIAGGMPLEEIGRNTLVISQTKGVIKKIFNVVDDAISTVEALQNGQEE